MADIRERFELLHLLQGLALIHRHDRDPGAWEATGGDEPVLKEVGQLVDGRTAAHWRRELGTPGAPRPNQDGWRDWEKAARLALEERYWG